MCCSASGFDPSQSSRIHTLACRSASNCCADQHASSSPASAAAAGPAVGLRPAKCGRRRRRTDRARLERRRSGRRRSDPLRRETAPLHARCRSPACPPSLRSRLLPTSPWKAVRPSAPGNRQAMPMIAMAGPNSENSGERASARACSSSPGPQDRPVSVIAMLSQSVGRQCLFIRYGTSFAGMRARRNHIRYILTGPH